MTDEEKKTSWFKDPMNLAPSILIVAAFLIGIAIFVLFLQNAYGDGYNKGFESGKNAVPIQTITPTPTPPPVQTPAYPTVLTYTVLSMTTAYGDYRIVTTTGQVLICANSYDYNIHQQQDTYTSTVNTILDGKYYITSPTLIAQHYNTVRDYRNYYNYDDDYYYRHYYGREPCAGNMVCG